MPSLLVSAGPIDFEESVRASFTSPGDAIKTPPAKILGVDDVAHVDIGHVATGQEEVIRPTLRVHFFRHSEDKANNSEHMR